MMEIKVRLDILRKHEEACYTICYYILQCEKLACEAAKEALLSLNRLNEAFYHADSSKQKALVRQAAAAASLTMKRNHLAMAN